jgi:hypothetical protein
METKSHMLFQDDHGNIGALLGTRYVKFQQGYMDVDGKKVTELDLVELEQPFNPFDDATFKAREGAKRVRLVFQNKEGIDVMIEYLTDLRDKAKGLEILNKNICDYEWSERTRKVFEAEGIVTVLDLVRLQRYQILAMRNTGKKTMEEIDEFVKAKHLQFGMEP